MNTRLMVRMTLPVMAISVIPLAVGFVTAWHVSLLQKKISDVLALNVASMRAAEELEIGTREVQSQLDRFLLTGDHKALDVVPAMREETDHWLQEAERAGTTPREQELMIRVRKGYEHFYEEFDRSSRHASMEGFRADLHQLVEDLLTHEVLEPAQEYLDFNEEEIKCSSEDNQRMTGRMVSGLILLGVCGPIAGLLAGFGLARGVSRSLIRLSVPICDAAGKLNEIVGPITLSAGMGIEELEVLLRKIADQIGAVIERLQQSQREVLRAEQLAAVGQMAAGMAHELRNPLMAIKILVQAAGAQGHTPVLKGRDLWVLEEEITRLERSIQLFLDYARPPQPEKRAFEAQRVLAQIGALVSSRAEQQGVRIECRQPEAPLVIEADMGQFRQVLLNLLLNALDAVAEEGTVRVELEGEPGGWLTLRVADSGDGLPAHLGAQIFEPFISTKETGIGLGLSICKRIVEAHGGTITAANQPGGGALFTVSLPLSPVGEECLASS
jgi:two-component system sensor histidine kinase HydH